LSAASAFSELWGKSGEKWDPKGRLQDFSRAGYQGGDKPIPDWPVKVNVRDFGAKGNGSADDTGAFQKAIDACPPEGTVWIPSGRYLITGFLKITNRSQIALRGEGPAKSVLNFPKGLTEIQPVPWLSKGATGPESTPWSWAGGFLWFENSTHVGIENVGFVFPDVPYGGHFSELGFNPVYFRFCKEAWARNLHFYNCDSGVLAQMGHHLTFENFVFEQFSGRGEMGGHHAVDFANTTYSLAQGIHFKNRFFHELGIEGNSHHNVFSDCSGPDLHLDHHHPDPHDNLWTGIDLGEGTSVWINNVASARNGGKVLTTSKGSPFSGSTSNEVYWNIKSRIPVTVPEAELNNIVVGLSEGPEQGIVLPANLFKAQLEKRLGPKEALNK